jgi:lysophospholipase L1-like esterase
MRLRNDFGYFECENFAVSGSTAEDVLAFQIGQAVLQNPNYLVLEVGSNDLCDDNPPHPTQFNDTYRAIARMAQKPGRAVVVVPIPNIIHLRNFSNMRGVLGMKAKTIWKKLGVCKDILVDGEDRTQLLSEYNLIIRKIADDFGFYFNDELVGYKFPSTMINGWDFFHPNIIGQMFLAEKTYPFKGEQ